MIDNVVHSRLIGSKGRNIRKIMEKYKVDIKFPRKTDPDPNIVAIMGTKENILDAKDHLLNLEEEYVSKNFFSVLVPLAHNGMIFVRKFFMGSNREIRANN